MNQIKRTMADRIKKDFLEAYKKKEFNKKNSLGLVKSEILELEKTKGRAEDIEVIKVIKKLLKGINESLEKGNANDTELLTEKELLGSYLPEQLTEKEIKEIINDLGSKTTWEIMKHFKEKYEWRVDNKLIIKVIMKK